MNEQNDASVDEKSTSTEQDPGAQQVSDGPPAADEFRLTIKKLDMPVRPRGVLAE